MPVVVEVVRREQAFREAQVVTVVVETAQVVLLSQRLRLELQTQVAVVVLVVGTPLKMVLLVALALSLSSTKYLPTPRLQFSTRLVRGLRLQV